MKIAIFQMSQGDFMFGHSRFWQMTVAILISASVQSAYAMEAENSDVKKISECFQKVNGEAYVIRLPVQGKVDQFYFLTPKNVLRIQCPFSDRDQLVSGDEKGNKVMSTSNVQIPSFQSGIENMVVSCGRKVDGQGNVVKTWSNTVAPSLSGEKPQQGIADIANDQFKKLRPEAVKTLQQAIGAKQKAAGLKRAKYEVPAVCASITGLSLDGNATAQSEHPPSEAPAGQ